MREEEGRRLLLMINFHENISSCQAEIMKKIEHQPIFTVAYYKSSSISNFSLKCIIDFDNPAMRERDGKRSVKTQI